MIKDNQVVSNLLDKTVYLPIAREDFQFSSRTRGKEFRDVSCTTRSQVLLLESYQSLTLENILNDLMQSILAMLIVSDRFNQVKESFPCLYLITDSQYGIKTGNIGGSNVCFKRVDTSERSTPCKISFETCGVKFSFGSTTVSNRPKYQMIIDGKKVLSSTFNIDPFSNIITHEYMVESDFRNISSEIIRHNVTNYRDMKLLLQISYLINSFQRLYRNQMSGKINIISPPTALGRGNVWGTYNGR